MRLLVLGGTVFLGRAITDAALAAGHSVTHFHRGRSRPPDPRVATVHGDRTIAADLQSLARDAWDAVIDTSGYMPQAVAQSAEALAGVRRYLFVSSISVYARFHHAGFDEDANLLPPPEPLPESLRMELYGPLKSACEAVVRERFGVRALVVRPGLIVGPHDPTDRFTYWPVRIARGGTVAAPGRPSRTVQFIDVRDLAEWMVRLLERGAHGTFNATGPREPLAMEALLDACGDAAGVRAAVEWLDDAFLLAHGVAPWKDMPLWIPESDEAMHGLMAARIDRALDAGLAFRPLQETVADTLAWHAQRPASHEWKAGISAERERQLLAAWKGNS